MKILIFFILSFLSLAGCSSPRLNTSIEEVQLDSLSEESFNRYNSSRITAKEKLSLDDISKANLACHQEKFYKGKSVLQSVMNQHKNNPLYWSALGTCYYLEGDYAKAAFFFETGIESLKFESSLRKSAAESILNNNMALLKIKMKKFDEAFDFLLKAQTLSPQAMTPQFNLAQLFLEFNFNDEAEKILLNLFSKNQKDIDVLYSLSLVYLRKNELDKSFSFISKVNPLFLNRSDIAGIFAFHLIQQDRLNEAKFILEKQIISDEYELRNKDISNQLEMKIKEKKQPKE